MSRFLFGSLIAAAVLGLPLARTAQGALQLRLTNGSTVKAVTDEGAGDGYDGEVGAIAFLGVQTWDLSRNVTPLRAALALGVFGLAVVSMSAQGYNPFLYFQF